MASLTLAYLLCLFGGYVGLHHLYLKRPYHAFAWLVSGGGFMFGVLWDLCELPNYVDECRHWSDYVRDRAHGRQPKCSTVRFVGQISLGCWLGLIALVAVPHSWWTDTLLSLWSTCFCALAITWGVYIVGNIGLQERQFGKASLVSITVCLLVFWYLESANGIIYAACAAAFTANQSARWRKLENRKRNYIYLLYSLLYWSMLACSFYNNGQIYYNGQVQPVPEAIRSFQEGFEWNKFVDDISLWAVYFQKTSVDFIITDILMVLKNILLIHTVANPRELDESYEIIGVSRFSSMKHIRTECRKLMKRFHPDKTGKSNDEQFIKIQQACHVLIRM